MSRYEIDCGDCGAEIGQTNDPREARRIAERAEHANAKITTRGLVNKVRYDRANKER